MKSVFLWKERDSHLFFWRFHFLWQFLSLKDLCSLSSNTHPFMTWRDSSPVLSFCDVWSFAAASSHIHCQGIHCFCVSFTTFTVLNREDVFKKCCLLTHTHEVSVFFRHSLSLIYGQWVSCDTNLRISSWQLRFLEIVCNRERCSFSLELSWQWLREDSSEGSKQEKKAFMLLW